MNNKAIIEFGFPIFFFFSEVIFYFISEYKHYLQHNKTEIHLNTLLTRQNNITL